MSAMDMDTCPHCEGQGAYWDDQTGQPDEPNGGRMITCWMCEGAGIEEDCPVLEYQRNGAVKGEVRA
jgi:DnaJ-class molecular chaperone